MASEIFDALAPRIKNLSLKDDHQVLDLICRYKIIDVLENLKKDKRLLNMISEIESIEQRRTFLECYFWYKTPYLKDDLKSMYFWYKSQQILEVYLGVCDYLELGEDGFTCLNGWRSPGLCGDEYNVLCRFVREG